MLQFPHAKESSDLASLRLFISSSYLGLFGSVLTLSLVLYRKLMKYDVSHLILSPAQFRMIRMEELCLLFVFFFLFQMSQPYTSLPFLSSVISGSVSKDTAKYILAQPVLMGLLLLWVVGKLLGLYAGL